MVARIWGGLSRTGGTVRRHWRASSLPQLVSEAAALIGVGVQACLPVWWTIARANLLPRSATAQIPAPFATWQVALFVSSVLYSPFYRFWLANRFKSKRLIEEQENRPRRLSEALARLALHAGQPMPETALKDVERAALENIRSEVVALVGDSAGSKVAIALIIPDPTDESRVRCINRADTVRQIPKSYPKDGMLSWECMRDGEVKYWPTHENQRGEPYKTIFALPLYLIDANQEKRGLGAVSVDHPYTDAFGHIQDKLKISLSPHLRLLELALTVRAAYPPRSSPVRKPRN